MENREELSVNLNTIVGMVWCVFRGIKAGGEKFTPQSYPNHVEFDPRDELNSKA